MATLAGITSVLISYFKEPDDYYDRLVDITSWTDDFEREKELKEIWTKRGMQPDYIINEFSELLPIVIGSNL